MKVWKKEDGRVPFAYVFAVIFVLMLLLAGIYASILNYHNLNSTRKFYEEADQNLRNIHDMVREKAYHIVMEVIHNVTEKRDPNIYMIQYYTFKEFSSYINKTFPIVTQDYNVTVGNYSIKVVMDYKKTRDFIKSYQLTWVDFTYMIDNLKEGYENQTQLPVYPYVVGYVNYTYHDKRTGYEVNRSMKYNRIIYSPLPLLKFVFDEFNTSTTNLGDFGRLIRYILTTVTQYRILLGYAAGGYGGTNIPVSEVLTKEDVEKAVNLALLLESVRFFHTYDDSMVNSMGIGGIIKKYLDTGEIDAADIYYAWKNMDNVVDVGRIIGQTIYGYADRFVFELMKLFWGDLSNEYFADPTLKEPIMDWDKIKQKGEDWARQMLYVYLDTWRKWLNIPTFILPHFDSADISVDFYILKIVHGIPILIPATAKMTWYVWETGVSDTINLILDPGSKREYFTLHTMAIGKSATFAYYGDYDYDLVKKSLVDEHKSYSNGGQYYNTLKYVIDALTRSVKQRSNTWDDTRNKGLVDYAAYETSVLSFDSFADAYDNNPANNHTILVDGSKSIINGPLQRAADEFSYLVPLRKETWWNDGAYKEYKNSSDTDAYLYALCKDTVDLWYQAMKNLYDGGNPSPSDDAGPYDSDCDSYPPSYQQSTWPTGYEGYPFNGEKHNGSFNFHRDLTRDAYNDVILLMWIQALEKGGIPIYSSDTVWDDVKDQTEDARQNVVGDNGLIKDLNLLFPYFYFNPISFKSKTFGDLRGWLDFATDTGTYDSNFYCLVRWRVGLNLIGYRGLGGCPPEENNGNNSGNNSGNQTTNVTGMGLDVSHYQGNIDWNRVAQAGYKFAFVKATQGTSYVDPKFSTNIQNGAAAGLMMGAYHFAEPYRHSAKAEADHFASIIQPYLSQMQLPPALDIEGKASSIGWSALSTWINNFMNELQSKVGITPVIYIDVNYARHLDSSVTQWPLWIADWTYDPNATPRTGKWSSWEYWQYSDKGSVPGISGSNIDLDKANGGKALATLLKLRGLGNSILDQMTDWIPESLNILYQNIALNARYTSIPIFPYMHTGRYEFWDTDYEFDKQVDRTKNETLEVDFDPDYLSNLNIAINLEPGHKFVDVQDTDYDMGKAPFEYQFNVQISGSVNINLMTPRTSVIYGGRHWHTWYNDTVKLNLHIKVPIYSAWYLESKWSGCTYRDNWRLHTDVPFSYTRGYFGVMGKDKKTKPFFISRELNNFIYDYESVSEMWNRYSTFYHFGIANAKDELAAWNYSYKNILLKSTKDTVAAFNNAGSQFSKVARDHQELCAKASAYVHGLRYFYFERTFSVSRDNISEDNGYQKYSYNFASQSVNEKYREGTYEFSGTMSSNGFSISSNEIYDGIRIHTSLSKGEISYYKASYHSSSHLAMKLYVEGDGRIYKPDFGFVGDSSQVSALSAYFPKISHGNINQEDLIKVFHHMLKDVYVNESIGYRFGVYVNLIGGDKELTYIVWYNGTPTPDSFIIWLNNEIRYFIYILGTSHFTEHGYDMLLNKNVYFSLNDLWMDTNYESSSIFGYREHGNFRGSGNDYVLNGNYNIDVPTPDTGHGDSS